MVEVQILSKTASKLLSDSKEEVLPECHPPRTLQ